MKNKLCALTISRIVRVALSVVISTPFSALAISYYDLTGANSSTAPAGINYAALNGSTYQGVFTNPDSIFTQSVGTGVIQPFIRIQSTGGTQRAYNTAGIDAAPKKGQFDAHDNEGSNWNRALALKKIPIVDIGGVKYREFILDINEIDNATDKYLSLDKFKLYLAEVGTLNNFNETNYTLTGTDTDGNGSYTATKIYDMDSGAAGGSGDNSIGLNYALNSGTGKGVDLVARIPDAFFKDATGDYVAPYVYLYSSFGEVGTNNKVKPGDPNCNTTGSGTGQPSTTCTTLLPSGDFGHTGGFEEWATKFSAAPEPKSLLLLLLGAGLLALVRGRSEPLAS